MSAVILTIASWLAPFITTISVSPNAEELMAETAVKAMLFLTSNGTFVPVVASRNPIDGKRLQFSVNTSWYGNPVPCIKGTEFDFETHGVTIYWYEDGKLNKCVSPLAYFESRARLSFLSSFNFLKGKTVDEALAFLYCVCEFANAKVRGEKVAKSIFYKHPEVHGVAYQKWFRNAIADAKGMAKKF